MSSRLQELQGRPAVVFWLGKAMDHYRSASWKFDFAFDLHFKNGYTNDAAVRAMGDFLVGLE
jgi:hypothetical protein